MTTPTTGSQLSRHPSFPSSMFCVCWRNTPPYQYHLSLLYSPIYQSSNLLSVSYHMCHLSSIIYLSYLSYLSSLFYHLSSSIIIIYHLSSLMYHLSSLTYHLSSINLLTFYLSCLICIISLILTIMYPLSLIRTFFSTG